MILTDYYKFDRLSDCKAKTRLDCTLSTKSYPEFEAMRNKAGQLFMYLGNVPERFNADAKRRADMALSKTKNISSVFVTDVTLPLAYGDVSGTNDALLFVFNTDFTAFDLFIARGQKNNRGALYNLLADNELNHEIEILKQRAVTETVTKQVEGAL